MISSSPKFSASVLDGCWVGPDTAAVATADGCLHIIAAVSRRPADKKMEGKLHVLSFILTLLHSERPKLHRVLALLSGIGLKGMVAN